MKLLVIGNGSIGVHENSEFYINNHTGNFLQELKKHHLITFTQGTTKYDKDNNLQNFDLSANSINYELLPDKKSAHFLPMVFALVKEQELLYLFYPGTISKIFALVAIILNKPFGLYIRGQYYNQNFLDRIILKRAKFILTVSPSFANDLKKYCVRTEVIKPMISITNEDLNENRDFYKKELKNILFVGRVEERKGINELIEIAQSLKKHSKKFILNIVGGGDQYARVKSEIIEKDLADHIILHGLISDKRQLKRLYDAADIFLFTSHDEGFPRVLYEAMASALPIFTTFVGGIPGRMENLRNCIEIPVKDPRKASELVLRHFDNSSKLKKIGLEGQQTVRKIINGLYASHEELLIKQLSFEK